MPKKTRSVAQPVPTPAATPRSAPARRVSEPRVETFLCPRCGRDAAKMIGRSDVLPIVYLRCDSCRLLSVTGA